MSYTNRLATSAIALVLLFSVPSLHAGGRKKDSRTLTTPTSLISITANLDGPAALPSNSEAATGDVTGTYDPQTHVLRFQARFLNLTGPATNAKFHGPAAIDRDGWATVAAARPEARLVSGTAWLNSEEEQDLLAGRWYFNVTTTKHPQGEIRGMVHVTNTSIGL
jgi:hypothetical protein